jgi:hypothetical protein
MSADPIRDATMSGAAFLAGHGHGDPFDVIEH